MTSRTVTGLFDSFEDAAGAIRDLEAAGVSERDLALVVNNADERYALADDGRARHRSGAGTGASIGTVLGGGAGLLAGLGMLAIPGIGPVVAAGWLVATAAGAAAGAAAGGLLGSLTGAGVSKEYAHLYAEGVRRGGTLVTACVDDGHLASTAEAILRRHRAVDPLEREKLYREEGWTGFDERAKPFSAEELARERNLYRENFPL
ncbi:MAG TPA: hypothetical protein VHT04_13745 [Stellaceae bacterium]|jgi:hypothetical protein|nr:hypothetical protein [Stellaceae bacterium]